MLICFGTRPEYLKIKPLLTACPEYKTVFTGQHEDLLHSIKFDYRMTIKPCGNRLNSIFTDVMQQSEQIFELEQPTSVLVQGDTTSAAAFAMSAFHHKIKIVHLEAGLRTYDKNNPYPEEVNRQLISKIADIHLCPTEYNKALLLDEKIENGIYVVGNTALDNLVDTKISIEPIILITLHRRENHNQIDEWFKQLDMLAKTHSEYTFILPIHPNPNVQKYRYLLPHIKVVPPLNHTEMIDLISKAKLIITDSGGIQEEASFLKKRTIICRKTTERPESLDQSGILCKDPTCLQGLFDFAIKSYIVEGNCPYGDGQSAHRIIKLLKELT
jgi:UDP-N-acetylglucosamine 2-epimerase (non-hydrolysing)